MPFTMITPNIFNAPSIALRVLEAFRADPFEGFMEVPLFRTDKDNPGGWVVSSMPISDKKSGNKALHEARRLAKQARDFIKASGTEGAVSLTGQRWNVRSEEKTVVFDYAGPVKRPSDQVVIVPDEIILTVVHLIQSRQSRWLDMSYGAYPEASVDTGVRKPIRKCKGQHNLFLEGPALVGLKTFYGLSPHVHLEEVLSHISRRFGVSQKDYDDGMAISEIISNGIQSESSQDPMRRIFSAPLGDSTQHIKLSATVEPGGNGFHEKMDITFFDETSPLREIGPLPEKAHSLWKAVSGTQFDESMPRSMQEYFQLTASIYGSR